MSILNNQKLTFIGAGNIAQATVKGLLKTDINPLNITVSDIDTEQLETLKEQGVNTMVDNISAVQNADIIILAVKPFKILDVIKQIKPVLNEKQLLVSYAANLTIDEVGAVLSPNIPFFRVIPNTAMAVRESITFVANRPNFNSQQGVVLDLFNQLGKALPVDENQIDTLTVLGSCGIAFVLRFIRALVTGGVQTGIPAQLSTKTVNQIVKGALKLLESEGNHPEIEIDRVTTPNGLTITGLNAMEDYGFSNAVIQGIVAAHNKLQG